MWTLTMLWFSKYQFFLFCVSSYSNWAQRFTIARQMQGNVEQISLIQNSLYNVEILIKKDKLETKYSLENKWNMRHKHFLYDY